MEEFGFDKSAISDVYVAEPDHKYKFKMNPHDELLKAFKQEQVYLEKELGRAIGSNAANGETVSLGPFELANLRISRKQTVKMPNGTFLREQREKDYSAFFLLEKLKWRMGLAFRRARSVQPTKTILVSVGTRTLI